MRGYPPLIKRTVMNKPREIRIQVEQTVIKYSGLNNQEYWFIYQCYDAFWDKASRDQHQEILACLHCWQLCWEHGLSTVEIN